MIIDPTTSLGKLRLRCADYGDIAILPDAVYAQTLVDTNNNLPQAAITCATYILGMLSMRVDRQMGLQLKVSGSQAFSAYLQFLLLTVKDPTFMMSAPPVPFGGSTVTPESYTQFVSDWKKLYYNGSEDQQNAFGATVSPNDGSLLGNFGVSISPSYGWTATGLVPY